MSTITVKKADSSVSVDSVKAVYGEEIVIPISCENATDIDYIIINGDGIVVAEGTVEPGKDINVYELPVGDYIVKVTTVTDNNHSSVSAEANLTINKAIPIITIQVVDIMYGEVVEFECGERGMVLDIQQNRIGCVIFGDFANIESGGRVRRVGRIASVPVGECLLGRVVDALGNPIDAMGYLPYKETRPIEYKAPGILDRAPVNSPLHTGIKAIDALVPIGKGQRELIIGDRQTGKTAIAVDTIINQKGKEQLKEAVYLEPEYYPEYGIWVIDGKL
jgi:hypothetical protein